MTEKSFARSRSIALAGLLLQVACVGLLMVLGSVLRSMATLQLSWFVLGGVPIWFLALLVFRQAELADLERMDLDELRRQKAATGGGEAMFDQEGGGGLGYLVAETRLSWMHKWLVPVFGLVTGLYLLFMGGWQWYFQQAVIEGQYPELRREHLPLALIGVGVAMLLLFLLSRFASGLGRVPQWQLLRACGSFTLGNVFAALALIICLGAQLYTGYSRAEMILASVVPAVMILVGIETSLNLLLDVYRPRTPGVEPRAAFDSRLLGLFAEPGGIYASIAEAVNYQFGFQVSQTWFYQLLQRAVLPLVWSGAAALWLLTCLVVVEPHQRAIIVSWGKQVNPESPLAPGIYFKLPYPFATVDVLNTEKLEQMALGRKSDSDEELADEMKVRNIGHEVVQWTDEKHGGFDEFNFVVSPSGVVVQSSGDGDTARSTPVHILRMTVAVQYRIRPEKLGKFTQVVDDPRRLLRNVAWQELVRYNASNDTLSLLGEKRRTAGETIRKRIIHRLNAMLPKEDALGLEVAYVGFQDVHPERSVATAFREVISAEQEKLTAIRGALTEESTQLSKVAGDREKALLLAKALEESNRAQVEMGDLTSVNAIRAPQADALRSGIEKQREKLLAAAAASWTRQIAQMALERSKENIALGIATSMGRLDDQSAALVQAETKEKEERAAGDAAIAPLADEARKSLPPAQVDAIVRAARLGVAVDFWQREADKLLFGLEGEIAAQLADAQARRWQIELLAAAELVTVQRTIAAYRAAPEIFKARVYWAALAEGLKDSRKFLMVFDPTGRNLKVRMNVEQAPKTDSNMLTGTQ